jgi:hypothetical protein
MIAAYLRLLRQVLKKLQEKVVKHVLGDFFSASTGSLLAGKQRATTIEGNMLSIYLIGLFIHL